MGDVLAVFLVSLISFGMFFFNVPYWTGQEMGDLAKNGFYRLGYVILSTTGWSIYKALETINKSVDRLFKIKEGGTVHAIINLLLYIVAVYGLCQLYDFTMSSVIGGDVDELHIADSSAYSRYSDLLLFWGILNNFGEVNSIGSFVTALRESIWSIVVFVVGTVMFFSVMYGLLMHKLQEIHLIERYGGSSPLVKMLKYEPEKRTLSSLPKQIIASILDFCNKLSILRNFKIFGVQIAFIAILAVYSIAKTVSGESADFGGLAADLLDESGIVSTIGSFIISFILGKLVVLVGRVVGMFMPQIIQEPLHRVSSSCNQKVEVIKEKRREWSVRCDSVYARTLSRFETRFVRVQEMHLD